MKLVIAFVVIATTVVLVRCTPKRGTFRNYFTFDEDRLAPAPAAAPLPSEASERNSLQAELMDICLREPGCDWDCVPGSEDECQCTCKRQPTGSGRKSPSESCVREPGCHWICSVDEPNDCKCLCRQMPIG